jgi:hypothetical protein
MSARRHASIRGAMRLPMRPTPTILNLNWLHIHVQETTGNMCIKTSIVPQGEDGGMDWLLSKEGKMRLSAL